MNVFIKSSIRIKKNWQIKPQQIQHREKTGCKNENLTSTPSTSTGLTMTAVKWALVRLNENKDAIPTIYIDVRMKNVSDEWKE